MHGDQDGLQGDFIEGALNYLEAYKSALLPRTIQPSDVIESLCAPPPPRININFDVGFFEDYYFQVAAVARDLEGRYVWWRARRFIGQPASVMGEARAALEGVKLAVDTGWGEIELEGENSQVVAAVQSREADHFLPYWAFIASLLSFLPFFQSFSCSFVRRSGNALAHVLAHFPLGSVDTMEACDLPASLASIS